MSLLEAFSRRPRGGGTPPTALTVQVQSYDTRDPDPAKHTVTGVDLMSSRTVTVSLRPDPDAATRKKPRPAIFDYETGKGEHGKKTLTTAGGVMRFDGAFPVGEAAEGEVQKWTASWPNSLAHTPDEAKCSVKMVRLITRPAVEEKGLDARVIVDIAYPETSVIVSNQNALEKAIADVMRGRPEEHNTRAALVRICSTDGGMRGALFLSQQSKALEPGNPGGEKKYVQLTPEECLASAKDDRYIGPKLQAALKAAADPENYVVEVIKANRLNMGKETVNTLANNGQILKIDKPWRCKNDDNTVEAGWRMTSLAVRTNDDGYPYVTHAASYGGGHKLFRMEDIPSPAFEGKAYDPPKQEAEDTPAP